MDNPDGYRELVRNNVACPKVTCGAQIGELCKVKISPERKSNHTVRNQAYRSEFWRP